MSLPPLVCNTPPPPDQCEDEKDPEDFDLSYSLSQDDDEDSNAYDYQTYANFNIYETTNSEHIQENNWSLANSHTFESTMAAKVAVENKDTDHITPTTNDLSEKLTFDDVTVEDLNLDINQEQINPHNTNTEKCYIDSCENNSSTKATTVCIVDDSITVNTKRVLITQSDNTCSPHLPKDGSCETNVENLDTKSQSSSQDVECDDLGSHLNAKNKDTELINQSVIELRIEKEEENLENKVQCHDDFEDFDDFQIVSSNNNITTIVENFVNPWINEIPHSSGFGHFKANFDESIENVSHIVKSPVMESVVRKNDFKIERSERDDNQDDFGDYDDFQSCSKQSKEEEQDVSLNQQVAALDFHSPESESQILESINNIFNSIFEQEISEPEYAYTAKLESVLNETWGYLVDTDVRQSYMVHWNNSLGQKSLLKALCIDSRNILFGPKWTYNMPKYAVNLSAAPLQPQKPLTSPLSNLETQIPDKSTVTETDTWTDPFSSNGQDSTYAEALLLDLEHLMATLDQMAHKHSTLKISELLSHASNNENENVTTERRPTDLEVFDKVKSKKGDKIYQTSLNVQPLRQINLPDTHIFTPSDSETPRSKTIHYDSGPSVILAHPVLNNEQTIAIVCPQSSSNEPMNKEEDDNDYWEFQNFKSTSETLKQPTNQQYSKKPDTEQEKYIESPDVPYQPQLLKPMKVKPIMPTLNWPEPGEVKETFDDFSEFVSSTSWDTNKKNETTADIHVNSEIKTLELCAHNNIFNKIMTSEVENNDDDFETFQSAPPVPQNIIFKSMESCINETTYQPSTSKIENKGNINAVTRKSNDIFIPNFTPENPNTNVTSVRDGFITNSPGHSVETPNILQPLPANSSGANSSRNQNNTGQILQPLSLESYSQINWPNPGIDLQDLSRFNPVETLPSLKSDFSNSQSKVNSPVHNEKTTVRNEVVDDDIWGDFVSSKPRQQVSAPKKLPVFGDEDEWTEFVSSPSVKPQNGLNTISLNVHTNLNIQKSSNFSKLNTKNNQISLDIPTLTYITPKSNHKTYNDKHFQNL